jgi:hypothetical protein
MVNDWLKMIGCKAVSLARLLHSTIWVPEKGREAMRDLVRSLWLLLSAGLNKLQGLAIFIESI